MLPETSFTRAGIAGPYQNPPDDRAGCLVHQFEILEQNVHSAPLEACISEGLKEAVFRKPRGPIPVSVIYTYRFSGLVEVPPEKG